MNNNLEEYQNYLNQFDGLETELDAWFLVSGDTDDFIFFGENDRAHSEK